MKEIKLIIADDYSLFREGLCSIIGSEPGFHVEGASSWKELEELSLQISPDTVVANWRLFEQGNAANIGDTCPPYQKYHLLVVCEENPEKCLIDAIKAGARGVILKNASKNDLLTAIRAVASGAYYFCKETSAALFSLLLRSTVEEVQDEESSLSKREKVILKYISNGFTNAEIAEKLFISAHTVATHRRNLLQKINAKNTAALVRYASKHGLLN